MPRWLLPTIVLADLVILGVSALFMGRPALLFLGVPLLIGTVVAAVVLSATSPARRRAPAPRVATGHRAPAADGGSWWVQDPDRDHAPVGWSGSSSWSPSVGRGDQGSADHGPGWSDSGSSCSADSGSAADSGSSSSSD